MHHAAADRQRLLVWTTFPGAPPLGTLSWPEAEQWGAGPTAALPPAAGARCDVTSGLAASFWPGDVTAPSQQARGRLARSQCLAPAPARAAGGAAGKAAPGEGPAARAGPPGCRAGRGGAGPGCAAARAWPAKGSCRARARGDTSPRCSRRPPRAERVPRRGAEGGPDCARSPALGARCPALGPGLGPSGPGGAGGPRARACAEEPAGARVRGCRRPPHAALEQLRGGRRAGAVRGGGRRRGRISHERESRHAKAAAWERGGAGLGRSRRGWVSLGRGAALCLDRSGPGRAGPAHPAAGPCRTSGGRGAASARAHPLRAAKGPGRHVPPGRAGSACSPRRLASGCGCEGAVAREEPGAGGAARAERGAPGGCGRRCRGGAAGGAERSGAPLAGAGGAAGAERRAGGRARCGRPGSERRPRAWPRPRAVPVAGPGPGRAGRCRDAAVAGGLAPVPRHVRAELARHRRALGHLHHLLRHHRRGGLHPALLGGRQREHAAARPLRPLPPVRGRGARGRGAGRARALLPRLLRRLRLHPVGRLPGRRLLRAALHGADAGLHRLLRALLLLQHGHGLQDLRLDAAAGSPLPGAGLHDLPGRLGRGDHPGHVRGEDGEVRAGRLLRALGLHPGHHRHPQRPHTLLPGLRPRQPAERPAARRAQDREQRFCWHCEDIM